MEIQASSFTRLARLPKELSARSTRQVALTKSSVAGGLSAGAHYGGFGVAHYTVNGSSVIVQKPLLKVL
jgi:hypothetical protein